MLYFAYGSNLHTPQLRARAPSARFLEAARLDDYRLGFTRDSRRWGGLAADVIQDEGASVWGALFDVSREDIVALDRSEYAGTGYRRVPVLVNARPMAWRSAFTYEVIDKKTEGRPPGPYIEQIIRGAQACGLPPTWLEFLETFR